MNAIDIGTWSRIIPFITRDIQNEQWISTSSRGEKRYNVEITLGKPIDILSLKVQIIESFIEKVQEIESSRNKLFRSGLTSMEVCPICQSDIFEKIFTVYSANYYKCQKCSHYFIKERPNKQILDNFYTMDKSYQKTYASKRTLETRVQQVAVPKLAWALKQFERVYGRKPKSILDVGAGSGHFVYACRNQGLKADGIELSESGIDFCKRNFDIELIYDDFIENGSKYKNYDIITLWGVIEHIPNPLEMLENATNALKNGNGGLVIAEVPRWNCFGTAVQKGFPDTIIRHLEPLTHIHIFTDDSIATAFELCGLDIIGAWYFGMDAYELITQLAFSLKQDEIIEKLKKHIPSFQNTLDLAKLSDEIVLAGKIGE